MEIDPILHRRRARLEGLLAPGGRRGVAAFDLACACRRISDADAYNRFAPVSDALFRWLDPEDGAASEPERIATVGDSVTYKRSRR